MQLKLTIIPAIYFLLHSIVLANKSEAPFSKIQANQTTKILVGDWAQNKKEFRNNRFIGRKFSKMIEITDPKVISAITSELIKSEKQKAIIYYFDVYSVLFIGKENQIIFGVDVYAMSKPEGACIPLSIVEKKNEFYIKGHLNKWAAGDALISPALYSTIISKYNELLKFRSRDR
ncbi:MAG: hypothetical protein ACK5NG_06370 [Chthoniobacterales bacterium]